MSQLQVLGAVILGSTQVGQTNNEYLIGLSIEVDMQFVNFELLRGIEIGLGDKLE